MVHLLLLFLLSYLHQILGAFHVPTCWPNTPLCIQQNSQHSWCYVPKAGETALTDCKGTQVDLQSTIDTHLNQDLSIAYYNGVDNSRLGGASWPVPAGGGIIRLCASGRSGDGVLQTICLNIAADDTFWSNTYCEVALGPAIVSDGCYSGALVASSPGVQQSATQTPAPTTDTVTLVVTPSLSTSSITTSSPESFSSSTASSTGTAPGSSNTTITIVDEHKTNKTTEIVVPIVVALIGLLGAIWKLRQ